MAFEPKKDPRSQHKFIYDALLLAIRVERTIGIVKLAVCMQSVKSINN